MPRIFLSAGEASGERYGAMFIEALRKIDPAVEVFGMGGKRMEDLGCRRIVRSEEMAVMGLAEVVRHLPHIYRQYRRILQSLRETPPDVAVLIDYPGFHLRLARDLHRLGIPVVYFVSPQLWAWKKRRIRQVERYVGRMLVIFPFEETFYRDRGVEATYVGHPLADLPLPTISRSAFAAQYGLDASKDWVALLPGSRDKEIRLNLPEIKKAADALNLDCEFLLPLAATLDPRHIAGIRESIAPPSGRGSGKAPRITLVKDARAALYHARASVVASGTATIEAALIGNPFLVVYRVSAATYAVVRHIVSVPFVAMVNLVAGRAVVPELIQHDFNASNVVSHLRRLMADETARGKMQNDLKQVSQMLHAGRSATETAIDRAAGITLQVAQRISHNSVPI
ncbi:MAG TPA: lipid-A-disaccharide synthase [Acidisarcina sp.]|nr:lipid-A-disaccharide synthase [Acidisarcina sp.]